MRRGWECKRWIGKLGLETITVDPVNLNTILADLSETGVRWLHKHEPPPEPVTGISIDSRSLQPGEIFVALTGERFDGHDFVEGARERGAAAAVVEERQVPSVRERFPGPLIAVPAPLEALERIAVGYRRSLSFEVSAVTGSLGKTTTKDFLSTLLGVRFRTVAAPRSFNNRVGVALTLLSAGRTTQQVVAEFGASSAGEISHLSRLVRPERVVITTVGQAHLSGFKDLEGVLAAKAEILDGLTADGTAFLNAMIPGLERLARRALGRTRTFGWETGDYAISHWRWQQSGPEDSPPGYRFGLGGEEFYLPVLGEHNLLNAAAAISVARDLKLSWDEIRRGLLECRLPTRRLERHEAGGVVLLDDAYNASPNSMRSAIETWRRLVPRGGRRVAVLGDMLELGDQSRRLHEDVGRWLAVGPVELLVTIGSEIRYLVDAFLDACRRENGEVPPETAHFEKTSHALEFLKHNLRVGDHVLFKASNRMGLSELAAQVREHTAVCNHSCTAGDTNHGILNSER